MNENPYETDRLLAEYLLFHYGAPAEILPDPPPPVMEEALGFAVRTQAHFSDTPRARGLDLGCAVGRSAYEMSRTCDEVLGIDFSRAFIDAADALRHRPLTYQRRDEGHLATPLEARLPHDIDAAKVTFEQGDATDLRTDLGNFDRVHAANLLCRLPDPAKLLARLPNLVARGGELILATPCTWLEEFTPQENWPPGATLDWLEKSLAPDFELAHVTDEPFLIRETARKYQLTTSQLSYWKRLG